MANLVITGIADVKTELERRKFPKILTLDDYNGIVDATLREWTRYAPIHKFVSFETKAEVNDYYIFDPNDATTAGICAGATGILDVIWSPGCNLNIDSLSSFFHQPSQMLIFRQKLDAWKQQFGPQGWDLVGVCGATTSFLRIFPAPQQDDAQVMIEMTTKLQLSDINVALSDWFYQWVEYYTADTLANLYATTAGVDLLNFADSKDAMAYWDRKAQRYYRRALDTQAGLGGLVARS